MKKLFSIVLIIFSFLGTNLVHAQTNSCIAVTSANYNTCCTGTNYSSNTYSCISYNDQHPQASSAASADNTTSTQSNTQTGSGTSCPLVDASNYNQCCTGSNYSSNSYSCISYNSEHSTPAPGTIGGGSLGTTPLNTVTFPTGNPSNLQVSSSGSADLAQCSAITFSSLLDILIWVKCIIVVAIIPLIFAAALMFFLWGVMKFIAASDSAKKEEGKKFIVAGLIGLFVMTSLWGIIKILGTTLGVESTVPLLQTTSLKE